MFLPKTYLTESNTHAVLLSYLKAGLKKIWNAEMTSPPQLNTLDDMKGFITETETR